MAQQLIRRGEVYWINLPLSNGRELQERHMGLVISNDRQNIVSPLITILPLTSLKEGERIHPFQVPSFFQNKKGMILVDQIRTVDRKRFEYLVDKVDEGMMEKIKKALIWLWLWKINPNSCHDKLDDYYSLNSLNYE